MRKVLFILVSISLYLSGCGCGIQSRGSIASLVEAELEKAYNTEFVLEENYFSPIPMPEDTSGGTPSYGSAVFREKDTGLLIKATYYKDGDIFDNYALKVISKELENYVSDFLADYGTGLYVHCHDYYNRKLGYLDTISLDFFTAKEPSFYHTLMLYFSDDIDLNYDIIESISRHISKKYNIKYGFSIFSVPSSNIPRIKEYCENNVIGFIEGTRFSERYIDDYKLGWLRYEDGVLIDSDCILDK